MRPPAHCQGHGWVARELAGKAGTCSLSSSEWRTPERLQCHKWNLKQQREDSGPSRPPCWPFLPACEKRPLAWGVGAEGETQPKPHGASFPALPSLQATLPSHSPFATQNCDKPVLTRSYKCPRTRAAEGGKAHLFAPCRVPSTQKSSSRVISICYKTDFKQPSLFGLPAH